jgi:hypothetical protein
MSLFPLGKICRVAFFTLPFQIAGIGQKFLQSQA